jgi:signal transduction histidine kinase/HAMP domain-containing protein
MRQAARSGAIVGAIVAGLVMLLVCLPALARGYPLALLPLLAAGPLAARGGSRRLDVLLLRGFVAGLVAAVIAVAALVLAVEGLGFSTWALLGAASYAPMPPLPRPDLLPLAGWPHEDILYLLPPLSALLAVLYGWLFDGSGAAPSRWIEARIVSARASIETKLVGVLLVLALLALVLGWVGFSALEDIHLQGHRLQLLADWSDHANSLGDELDRAIDVASIADRPARQAALAELAASLKATLDHLEASPAHLGIAVPAPAAKELGATYAENVRQIRTTSDVLLTTIGEVSPDDSPYMWRVRDARLAASRAQFGLVKRLQADTRATLDRVDLQHHASLMTLLALVVMTALAGVVLGRAVARGITEPIGAMTAYLSRIARGDFSGRLSVRNRDELGALTEQLNAMAAELEQLYTAERDDRQRAEALSEHLLVKNQELERVQKQLEQARDVLEITVDERTAALRMANEQLLAEVAERKRAEEALRRAHVHLETRVEQRTEELANINVALQAEIAERQRAEEERARSLALEQAARQRLEESNRALARATQAKSEFLATMSHEFRTPLNSIIGFSELLLDDDPSGTPPEQRQRFATNIYDSGSHLLNLVNDILDLSKVEAGRMELYPATFGVASSLRAVEASIQPLADKKGLTLSTSVAPEITTVYADEGRFKQVLYNLLSNAVKFTPTGGRVDTVARLTYDAIEVTVADTGIGIAPEDQARIFEAFQQLDSSAARRHQGTGLGLALTRRLVELQGGRIWVESAPGKGTRLRFTLPLRVTAFVPTLDAATPPDRAAPEEPPAASRPPRAVPSEGGVRERPSAPYAMGEASVTASAEQAVAARDSRRAAPPGPEIREGAARDSVT